ncbi:MAG: 2-iminoacetate synthase ThiH [Candidatus Margulisiibacteriota bacterium]|jgi:2-iminoacetate synthase
MVKQDKRDRKMSFTKTLAELDLEQINAKLCSTADKNISLLCKKNQLSYTDLLALLNPKAIELLAQLARRSEQLTRQHFGRAIHMYAPVYLSNECTNNCVYCGFNLEQAFQRKTLSVKEMETEFEVLKNQGFDHVLLLTGEAPLKVDLTYLESAVSLASKFFAQVSLEIYPLGTEEYKRLVNAGASGLTIYQETYDRAIYKAVHLEGQKADYEWRLAAPERALEAGFRKVGLGILLGLADWRLDAAILATHAQYLMKKYWQAELSLSFPRISKAPENFASHVPVSEQDLVQMVFAMRLFLPEINLVLSTREGAILRDNLIGYGITQISAGSKTNPGGYQELDTLEQFAVEDARDLTEVISAVNNKGYDIVLKDWDRTFQGVTCR